MSDKEFIDNPVYHPMEDILDLEPGTTNLPVIQRSSNLVQCPDFDEKDKEIEDQMQEVYDAAMSAFESQAAEASLIAEEYRARNHEVAAQYLNTALAAAKEKASMKQHKDKLNVAKINATKPGTLNQNLIVADRNDLLKHILKGTDGQPE